MKAIRIIVAVIGALVLADGLLGIGPARDVVNARAIAGAILLAGSLVAAAVARSSPVLPSSNEAKTQR